MEWNKNGKDRTPDNPSTFAYDSYYLQNGGLKYEADFEDIGRL